MSLAVGGDTGSVAGGERAALTLGLVILFLTGYFGVGQATDPARAGSLATSLDHRIPFLAWSVWPYLLVFPAAFYPLFTVRCRMLYRRLALAYAVAMVVSYVCFVIWPVTSIGFRADAAILDPSTFSDWGIRTLYDLDPPFNLFPSLHLSIAALAALAAWKARRIYGVLAFVVVGMILISISTVKQHFVADGIGGLALASLIHAAVLRPYRPPEDGSPTAFPWIGPGLFLSFLALVYAGFYVLYRVFA